MTVHSHIGASGMYRWAPCPGSVRLAKTVPNTTTVYAAEGTVAHDIAASCLFLRIDAHKFVGEKRVQEGHTIEVTEEMADSVNEYVAYIESRMATDTNADLLVEHRFDLSHIYKGCFGTADAVMYFPKERLLEVPDFKYGAGIAVEAEGNPQLSYYALGALVTANFPAVNVRKTIVQPRCPHPQGSIRSAPDVHVLELIDFRADLVMYARRTEDANAPLVPGDHCRFCPAAGICPALHARAMAAAQSTFRPVATQVYDPVQLAKALEDIPLLEARIKNLREFAYAEAEAGRFTGHGWKIVAKRPTRKWRSDGEVAEALQDIGVPDDTIYEPRNVRSPKQLEDRGISKQYVARFTKSESSGHSLVPESDARPAVRAAPQQVFSPVPAQIETKGVAA